MENPEQVTYIGETDYRNKALRFGIKDKDRSKHLYVIGKTGMGKSTLLENMAIQDIQNGKGMAFIDPHGGTAETLLDYVPESRIKDVIYFAPHDTNFPVAFNPLEDVDRDKRHLVADGLMAAFKKIWPDVWSARMEYILQNTLLALIEYPDATLMGVNRMLSDKAYRNQVIANVTDPGVKSFWVDEFANYTERMAAESVPAIQNKIGQFTSNPIIRNIMGQPKSSFDLRKVMDDKKILIMNLSKGQMGEGNAALVGGMLITKIYLAAMSRAGSTEAELSALPSFYFYVDEFQSFVNDSFADILSEARKYKLSLTIAHQYVEQMPESVRDAVFGNVGTTISFRIGPFDAEVLEKVFAPKFTMEDLVNLQFAQVYMSLMIDGVGSPPFSAKTLPRIEMTGGSLKSVIIEHVRRTYARPRAEVEEEINRWHSILPDGTEAPPKKKKRRRRKKKGGGEGNSEAMSEAGVPNSPGGGSNSLADLLAGAMKEKDGSGKNESKDKENVDKNSGKSDKKDESRDVPASKPEPPRAPVPETPLPLVSEPREKKEENREETEVKESKKEETIDIPQAPKPIEPPSPPKPNENSDSDLGQEENNVNRNEYREAGAPQTPPPPVYQNEPQPIQTSTKHIPTPPPPVDRMEIKPGVDPLPPRAPEPNRGPMYGNEPVQNTSQNQNEIPEDELRRMLDV